MLAKSRLVNSKAKLRVIMATRSNSGLLTKNLNIIINKDTTWNKVLKSTGWVILKCKTKPDQAYEV